MIYNYRCKDCGHKWEANKNRLDPHPILCPECKGVHVNRAWNVPTITYKGTGWTRKRIMTVTKNKPRYLRNEIVRVKVELKEAKIERVKARIRVLHLIRTLMRLEFEAREEGIDVSIDDDAAND